MKIIYHKNDSVRAVTDQSGAVVAFPESKPIVAVLVALSQTYPDEILVWCHEDLKDQLEIDRIGKLLFHNKMMISYEPSANFLLGTAIGYVDESPFIKVNMGVTFPTWQMSAAAGAVHASVVNALGDGIQTNDGFGYFLNSFAKRAMPLGLWCYSEPGLLKKSAVVFDSVSRPENIFRFVKQHYKTRWVLLLMMDLIWYEKRFPLVPFLRSFFYGKRAFNRQALGAITIGSPKKISNKTVDVIIPTIGRKKYLYDVLTDLKNQHHLPSSVIIVEQNPQPDSQSELDYLHNEPWPFRIRHEFIHQAGACHSRNIGLGQVTADWVFLADDDIRFEADFIQKTFDNIEKTGAAALTLNCIQNGDKPGNAPVFQWPFFGSGCSFVRSENVEGCRFSPGYEFGFGEDLDFGMQLRNTGCDIIYLPEPVLLHLKAPVGGFRTKPVLKWSEEQIQPKPSPTVMLYKLLYNTKEQLLGYKTTLFLNYYRHQSVRNPFAYYSTFKKQWNQSLHWANKLRKAS